MVNKIQDNSFNELDSILQNTSDFFFYYYDHEGTQYQNNMRKFIKNMMPIQSGSTDLLKVDK
jgi:hypothetical protein